MKRAFLRGAIALFAFAVIGPAAAADPSMPLKALAVPTAPDWTGFYLGGHFGYATGTSNWVGTEGGASAPTLNGSLDLFNSYDAFKGTGSFFAGLQAGYNYMLPSRFLVGFEADFSAPNTIAGTQAISSALSGQVNYSDIVLQMGTARGRVGYVFVHWVVLGTGGGAWAYDKFGRPHPGGRP